MGKSGITNVNDNYGNEVCKRPRLVIDHANIVDDDVDVVMKLVVIAILNCWN